MKNSVANTGDDKIVYLLSFLWFNRILQAAMEKLYINNTSNETTTIFSFTDLIKRMTEYQEIIKKENEVGFSSSTMHIQNVRMQIQFKKPSTPLSCKKTTLNRKFIFLKDFNFQHEKFRCYVDDIRVNQKSIKLKGLRTQKKNYFVPYSR
jgi:hypothetical protein